MPVGPQHPALKEAIFLRLDMAGNIINDAQINTGYMHKGIEHMMVGSTVNQALVQVERVCGICSQAHAQVFTNTVEFLMPDLKLSDKVKYERMIICEMERIHSHLVWAGVLLEAIGLHTMFMFFWRERERVLDCFDVLTGGRVHHAVNAIGSNKHDFSREDLEFIESKIGKVDTFIKEHTSFLTTQDVIVSRYKGVGVVTREVAEEFDMIGPIARASGIKIDVRKDMPYELYDKVKFDLITEKDGDAFARLKVRLKEITEAIKIIRQCMKLMPVDEKIPVKVIPAVKDGTAYAMVEAPRGSLFHFVKVKNNKVERIKIRTPTFKYMNIFPQSLKGLDITHLPVVLESFDPCFSCMERSMVVKGGRQFVLKDYLKGGKP
jgi:NADH-quinone oxidoreductase subunit D